MDLDWVSDWSNYLVGHRDLKNWAQFGRECAKVEVERAWSILDFYKDPSELMLSDSAIEEHAEEQANWVFGGGGLRLYGSSVWEKYRDQAEVSAKEHSAWLEAYIETYRELIDGFVKDLIPKEIRGKLPFFCELVSGMRRAIDDGRAKFRKPFGVSLGARQEPEEKRIEPSRQQIVAEASRDGRKTLERDWNSVSRGEDARIDFPGHMLRYAFTPRGWELTENQDHFFKETYAGAYMEALEEKLKEFAPSEAWRNASLICLVYDQMVEQGIYKVRKGDKAGFEAFRDRERRFLEDERRRWQKEQTEKAELAKKEQKERRELMKKSKK